MDFAMSPIKDQLDSLWVCINLMKQDLEMAKSIALTGQEENRYLQERLSELEAKVEAYHSSDVS